MKELIAKFQITDPPLTCERYGHGHINETYLVDCQYGARYVLQKINKRIFTKPVELMENIAATTAYILAHTDDPRAAMHLVLTKDGKALYLHCLPADITGLSCEEGEVDNSVFDRYLVPLYKQASYKPMHIFSSVNEARMAYDSGAIGLHAPILVRVIKTFDGQLSDCVPILVNGKAVWYVTNNSAPVFYQIDVLSCDHSYTSKVTTAATCTANGTETAKCDRCDATDTRTAVDTALGHSFTNYVYNNDATCTEDGTETAKCDRCDVTNTRTAVGTALGHSFTKYISDENGNRRPKKQTVTKKNVAPNTGAAIFLLTNIAPERWKNKMNTEHSGTIGSGLSLIVESEEDKELVKQALKK